jgi:hypothetical protein
MPFDSLPAVKPETKDAQVLREAMDIIRDKDAWTKGNIYCGGRHCMAGAIMRAMGLNDQQMKKVQMVGIACNLSTPILMALNEAATQRSGKVEYFWGYNDRATTSHADVMAVMQAAYERLRWGDSE